MPVRRNAAAVLLLPLLLACVSGLPTLPASRTGSPYALLLGVIGLLAWACTGWLLLVLLLSGASRAGSRVAQVLVRRVAPASVRGLCGLAVGAAVAVAAAPGPAAADAPHRPPAGLDLDWGQPVAQPAEPTPTPSPVGPLAPAPAPTQPRQPVAGPDPARVLVRAGDSLWSIAAAALGPRATDREVARAWPGWWAANRGSIGDDPDLIHPGDVLVPPPSMTHDQGEA